MPKLIYLDPGHGGYDSGATGVNGMVEKDYVLELGLLVKDILENNFDVIVKMTRETDEFIGLSERADMANQDGADLFVSLHNNAYNGEARGFETFIFETLSDSSSTAKIQDVIHKHLWAFYNQFDTPNRGQKKANFAVVRETAMSAILIENLFIDNAQDAEILNQNIDSIATAIAEAIAKALNLPELKKVDDVKYRVMVGSFENIEDAQEKLKKLENAGFNGVVVTDKL